MLFNYEYKLTLSDENLESYSYFEQNKFCPICLSTKYEKSKSNYKNVYTELISNYLNFDEDTLIEFASSQICSNCKAYYWGNQISAKLRVNLYNKILPTHPKGIDSTGKFFSIKGLKEKIHGIEDSSPQKMRIMDGYMSSFEFESDYEKEICKSALKNLNNKKNISILEKFFNRGPKSFSRHAGFRNTFLNDYIIKYFEEKNEINFNYIEYGCPCWGPLSTFVRSKYKCLSIIPKNSIFWSNYSNDYYDYSNLSTVNESDLNNKIENLKGASLGLILILDHIENPISFLKKFINYGIKSISIIVEKIETKKGLPIQHLTGWNKESLIYLAQSLNLNIKYLNHNHKSYLFAVFEL